VEPVQDLKPLTALRFFAAAMIVALHATNYFPWAAGAKGLPLEMGVSFFFVLSGFILTHVYSQRRVGFARFLATRLARLWPVHAVTCAMVLLFIRADSQQLPGTGFFDPMVVLGFNLTLLHALVPFQIYAFSWNSVSWSISTELFFYLAFPALLVGIGRNWPWKLAACAAIILAFEGIAAAFGIPAGAGPTELNLFFMAYASPLFRSFEFVLGMAAHGAWLAARHWLTKKNRATVCEALALALTIATMLGIASISMSVRNILPAMAFWVTTGGACFAFALLIVAFADGRGVLGRLLSTRPLVWLGEISFALYMVHQILMKWIFIQQLEGKMQPAGPLLVMGACLLAAATLHHLVELPARQALLRLLLRQKRAVAPP